MILFWGRVSDSSTNKKVVSVAFEVEFVLCFWQYYNSLRVAIKNQTKYLGNALYVSSHCLGDIRCLQNKRSYKARELLMCCRVLSSSQTPVSFDNYMLRLDWMYYRLPYFHSPGNLAILTTNFSTWEALLRNNGGMQDTLHDM